jgi:hypothetical protein
MLLLEPSNWQVGLHDRFEEFAQSFGDDWRSRIALRYSYGPLSEFAFIPHTCPVRLRWHGAKLSIVNLAQFYAAPTCGRTRNMLNQQFSDLGNVPASSITQPCPHQQDFIFNQ